MRRLLPVALLLLLAAGGSAPQRQSDPAPKGKTSPAGKVREDWKRHFNAKNADAVAALYAEDAVVVSEAGTLTGPQEIHKWVQMSLDQGSVLEELSATQEKSSGSLAYGTGRSRRLVGQEVHLGQYLVVIEKRGAEWKIVRHFSMNLRENPSPSAPPR